MKNSKLKKENAITLIALVITIVILLILAAVSINAVIGDNGIITKSREAKLKMQVETEKEKINLAINDIDNLTENLQTTKVQKLNSIL